MNDFFLLYALTITLELVLSLVMALFIFLIIAPPGAAARTAEPAPTRPAPAHTAIGALQAAFATISEGRDDLATIMHAQALLERQAASETA
jgi:hypothetical protein